MRHRTRNKVIKICFPFIALFVALSLRVIFITNIWEGHRIESSKTNDGFVHLLRTMLISHEPENLENSINTIDAILKLFEIALPPDMNGYIIHPNGERFGIPSDEIYDDSIDSRWPVILVPAKDNVEPLRVILTEKRDIRSIDSYFRPEQKGILPLSITWWFVPVSCPTLQSALSTSNWILAASFLFVWSFMLYLFYFVDEKRKSRLQKKTYDIIFDSLESTLANKHSELRASKEKRKILEEDSSTSSALLRSADEDITVLKEQVSNLERELNEARNNLDRKIEQETTEKGRRRAVQAEKKIENLTAKLKREKKELSNSIRIAKIEGILGSIDVHPKAHKEMLQILSDDEKRKFVWRELKNICRVELGTSYEDLKAGTKIKHNPRSDLVKFYFDLSKNRPRLLSVLPISKHPKGHRDDKRIVDRQKSSRAWTNSIS